MKSPKYFLLALTLLSVFSDPVFCQPQDSARQKFINAARKVMNVAHYCTLITLDENQRPVARILDAFEPDSNLIVWMGTNPRSRKVEHIRANPEVTLFYFDSVQGYVCIQGKAELINDSLQKSIHWKEEWKGFYPDRNKDYLLIKVIPQTLDLLAPESGLVGDRKTWKTPFIKLNE